MEISNERNITGQNGKLKERQRNETKHYRRFQGNLKANLRNIRKIIAGNQRNIGEDSSESQEH